MKIQCIFAVCLVLAAAGVSNAKPEETEYYAVFMDGNKIGHSALSRVVADGKVTTTKETSVDVNRAVDVNRVDVTTKVVTTEVSIETPDGKPLGFKVAQKSGEMAVSLSGTVDAQWIMDVTSTSMGKEQKKSFGWPSGAVMAEGLRLLQLEKGLKEGLEYNVKMFDPPSLKAIEATIRIGPKQNVDLLGRVAALTEVKTIVKISGGGEIVSTSYVDENCDTKKSIIPTAGTKIEMIACTKEVALGENDTPESTDKVVINKGKTQDPNL